MVLFLRRGGTLRIDVLEEIQNLCQQRIFVFVDRAALHNDEIELAFLECRKRHLRVTLIVAERDNEWNARCDNLDKYVRKEFYVRYLSETEVRKLVKKLEEHKALGYLEEYDEEERVYAFVHRARRQLLVALHEVTAGRAFDDIVLDEYERIIPREAQQLYLDVCTLNKFGAGVRAGLIHRISGIDFQYFRDQLLSPLENVVDMYFDKYVGDYLFVARHEHVAQIVFDRVLADQERRFDQIVNVMSGIDPDYSSDGIAFRQLIKGGNVSDMFASQELGRKIFSEALRRFGEEAYLYQQAAIFEMRHSGGSIDTAEKYARQAVELAPHDRSIRHTLANVCRQQANTVTNELVRGEYRKKARRELSQNRNRGGVTAFEYYTSAQLYLDELQERLSGEGENTEKKTNRVIASLIQDIELILNEGLQRFPGNENLLGLDARYGELIDQDKRAERALQTAFETNPRSEWIAVRYSRLLDDLGYLDRAKDVLKRCVLENPSSKIAHFHLGKLYSLKGLEEEKKWALEHLSHGFTDGDPNWEARFWYGRELFLNGQGDKARQIFEQTTRAPVSAELRNRNRAKVRDDSGLKMVFEGSVVKKEEGYIFIQSPDFGQDVYGHVSEVAEEDWPRLTFNRRVRFHLGFTMRGPAASDIRILE